jgi:hypothetical protein
MSVRTIKFFAAVVTADVLIAVLRHWRGYDLVAKLLAIVLLTNLVVLPATVSWGRIKRYDWHSLLPAYMLLLLATILFNLR